VSGTTAIKLSSNHAMAVVGQDHAK